MSEDINSYISSELSQPDKARKSLGFTDFFKAIEDSLDNRAQERIKQFEEKTVGLIWGVVITIGMAVVALLLSLFGIIFHNWNVSQDKMKSEIMLEMYKLHIEGYKNIDPDIKNELINR